MQMDEAARLRALRDLNLLDTAPSEAFDRITRMASQLFSAPLAAVSLTDENRQWFKSRVGCGSEIPRDKAPCAEVTRTGEVLVVPDLAKDSRFVGGILVRNGVRFYAGAPLITRTGFNLGSMCVLDMEPRTITSEEAKALADLAAMVMAQIELQHSLGRIDPVSGLPNRNQFAEDLADMSLDHPGEERVAVVIDLADAAQLVQAMRVLGPSCVDDLIAASADAAKDYLGPGTILYHVGATQFLTVLAGDGQERTTGKIAAHLAGLRSSLRAREFVATDIAVGIAPFRLGDEDAGNVLRAAHSAAQDARESDMRVGVYSPLADALHQRR
jgi:GGDEF domain-containing protein